MMPQFGEEEIINRNFKDKGVFVDIGAYGRWSNTDFLLLKGWTGKQFDGATNTFITVENIRSLLPEHIDLLSIDIDGNDYWVWKEIQHTPKMVIIEFNPTLDGSFVYPYDKNFVWKGDNNYGSSKLALIELGIEKGYSKYEITGDNLVFIYE